MSDIDYERAAQLMDVIHKVSTISPTNTGLLGMAQAELKEIEAVAAEERAKLAAKQRQEEAEAQSKRDAEAAKKADEEEQLDNGGRFSQRNQNPTITRRA